MTKFIENKLLKKITQEIKKNPNQGCYGLYKNYSDLKGNIYKENDNISTIVTSSHTYINQLIDMGYKKVFVYNPSIAKIVRL